MNLQRMWMRKLYASANRKRVRVPLHLERLEERCVPALLGPATTTQVGAFPEGIASGDLDGGKPDLVVANQNGNSINVLLNDGNGNHPTSIRP